MKHLCQTTIGQNSSNLLTLTSAFTFEFDSWHALPNQVEKLHHETEQLICGHRLSVVVNDLHATMAEHREWETQTFTERLVLRNRQKRHLR